MPTARFRKQGGYKQARNIGTSVFNADGGISTRSHISFHDLKGIPGATANMPPGTLIWKSENDNGRLEYKDISNNWHILGTGAYDFWKPGTGTAGYIHYDGGNVGIGIGNPAAKLHVIGNIHVNTDNYKNEIGYFTGASGATGNNSTAIGYNCKASGNWSTAMGSNTTASGNYSTAMGENTTASDNFSTAMGGSTTASGNYSTAMGGSTTASGNYSTAMGENTTASDIFSTAMGYQTLATGAYSTAMGAYSGATGDYCTAIGNKAYAGGDIQFAIGASGTAPGATASSTINNNALVILKNGNVGIGTTGPTVKLEVDGDISCTTLRDATGNAGTSGQVLSSTGSGLQWVSNTGGATGINDLSDAYSDAANFNLWLGEKVTTLTSGTKNTSVGQDALKSQTTGGENVALGFEPLKNNTAGEWNIAVGAGALLANANGGSRNIAIGSKAFRYLNTTDASSNTLNGSNNVAIGDKAGNDKAPGGVSIVTGGKNVLLGYRCSANKSDATNQIIIGAEALGIGDNSVVLGNSSITKTELKGNVGIGTTGPAAKLHVIGNIHVNIDNYKNEIGYFTGASGATVNNSTAIGYQTKASGDWSTAMGQSTVATGWSSTAMGYKTKASGNYSTAMGLSTLATGPNSTAMGQNTVATGFCSTAMGEATTASGDWSTAMGAFSLAKDDLCTAIGNNAYAGGEIQFAIGASDIFPNTIAGAGDASNNNVLSILKNGNVGIGTDAPTAELDVSGNIRCSSTDISGTLKVRGELQMNTSGVVIASNPTSSTENRIQTVVMNRTAGIIRMENVTIVGGASGVAYGNDSYAYTDLFNNKIGASSVVLSSINCGGSGSERLSLSGGGSTGGSYRFIIANLGVKSYVSAGNQLEISFLVINPLVDCGCPSGAAVAAGVAIADMPANRGQSPAVAGYNNKLYVFGGKYGSSLSTYDTFVVYDTITNSWSQPTPTMSEKRAWVYGAIWQDKVYIYSGTDDQTTASHQSMEIYDIVTNSFSTVYPTPDKRTNYAAGAINGKIYICGGEMVLQLGIVSATDSLIEYDISTDNFTTKTAMPTSLESHAAAVYNNKLYVMGGKNAATTTQDQLYVYNPALNTWTTLATMPASRYGLKAVTLGSYIYAVGGGPAPLKNTVYKYDPATNTWSTETPMLTANANFGLGVANNAIFAVGNADGTVKIGERIL